MHVAIVPGDGSGGNLSLLCRCFQFRQTLAADGVDDAAQFLGPFAKPRQFFGIDPVMLGIAGPGLPNSHSEGANCRYNFVRKIAGKRRAPISFNFARFLSFPLEAFSGTGPYPEGERQE